MYKDTACYFNTKKNRWYRTRMRVDEKGVISGCKAKFFFIEQRLKLDTTSLGVGSTINTPTTSLIVLPPFFYDPKLLMYLPRQGQFKDEKWLLFSTYEQMNYWYEKIMKILENKGDT